jgi:hypothetical protein
MSADELARAVELLVRQVGHWTPARWSRTDVTGSTRAEELHRLVQLLADLAADTAGEPRRAVPRLDNDLALPDQLRVVTADLLAVDAASETLRTAVAEVNVVRRGFS